MKDFTIEALDCILNEGMGPILKEIEEISDQLENHEPNYTGNQIFSDRLKNVHEELEAIRMALVLTFAIEFSN